MKILLFGKAGQVGWELQRSLAVLGDLTVLGSKSKPLCGDFKDLDGIRASIQAVKPDVIVNAAAQTAVDKMEDEPALAQLVNAQAPAVIAEEANKLGALLVHYSTDYVFDGSGDQPWQESEQTNPLSIYGQSKLDAETAIEAVGGHYLIFRTSWVYAARGRNFAKTMFKLAKERETLSVIADQVGAPTGAELIADVTAHAISVALKDQSTTGIYHLVASGDVSWHGYAQFVLDYCRDQGVDFKVSAADVLPVPTTEYPTPATRPLNSRLKTDKLQKTFNLTLPHWQKGVAHMLDEFLERRA